MNYFELFGLKPGFQQDAAQLAKTYVELQKKYHPDYFGQAGDQEKEEMLQLSSMVNQAYKTLRSRDLTAKYLLQLNGMLEEEEKYSLPPDFLMEVMELNEMKMDGADPEELSGRVKAMLEELNAEIQPVMENFDASASGSGQLLQLKEWYFRKKYLDRLLAG
jgi:molecular chaperone HscB